MTGASSILEKPVRRKRASFVLTSLIDVIFLLVIFFMVSSQIVPFSMIALAPMSNAARAGDTPTPSTVAPVAVRVLKGGVSIGGKKIDPADVETTFAQLKADGIETLILIPGADSTVQDLVAVLEASKAVAFANVTIVNRRGG